MPTRRRFLQCAPAAALPAAWITGMAYAQEAPMNRRPIPSTREMLPVIGLGTANTFNVDPQGKDMAPLEDVLKRLIAAAGKNALIDTAPSYGQSEAVTGELLARTRSRDGIFVATKIGTSGEASALQQIHASQTALKSSILDLIQIHNLVDTVNQLALLRDLKQQGVTRYVGITHYTNSSHDELTELVKRESMDFVQINLSVRERGAEKRLLPACQAKGVAVLINRPFQDGSLFSLVRGKPLPDWAAEIGCQSWAQVFLKFIVGHPAVTCVIPATSKPGNMADNLLAGFGRMPDAAMRQRIANLFA
jgi:diketogulonate reductase-like aldo/keto reductase